MTPSCGRNPLRYSGTILPEQYFNLHDVHRLDIHEFLESHIKKIIIWTV